MTADPSLGDFEKELLTLPRNAFEIQIKLYDICSPIVGATIIGLNFMVVLSSGLLLQRRQQPRSTYIFLGNVALADLVIGVATFLDQYYPGEERSQMVCCIILGTTISAALASVYSIGLIAIDRFLYILYGLQYQRYVSSKRARLMVSFAWVLGIVVGFLPAMGIRNPTNNGPLCWFILLEPTSLVLATNILGLIPFIVITILYSIILRRALGKIAELRQAAHEDYNRNLRYFRGGNGLHGVTISGKSVVGFNGVSYIQSVQQEQEMNYQTSRSIFHCCRTANPIKNVSGYSPSRWKAIKIVLFTTGSFFITWFPFFFASTLFAICNPEKTPMYCDGLRVAIENPLTILGLSNSLINPIIYAWWHNGFREAVKKLCTDVWRKCFHPKLNILDNTTRSSDGLKRSKLVNFQLNPGQTTTAPSNGVSLVSVTVVNVNDCE